MVEVLAGLTGTRPRSRAGSRPRETPTVPVLWIATMIAVASGCSDDHSNQCPPPSVTLPLRVTVQDSITGADICGAHVTAAIDGETAVLSGQCVYVGGSGPGTYDVTAEKDGYQPATVPGIEVRRLGGSCPGWVPVDVEMMLQPKS